jgi:hypothetical protein
MVGNEKIVIFDAMNSASDEKSFTDAEESL